MADDLKAKVISLDDQLPGGIYMDGFLTSSEASQLSIDMNTILQKRKQNQKTTYGITGYTGPVLVVFGSTSIHPKLLFGRLPPPLKDLVKKVCIDEGLGELPFQITVNFYQDWKKELIPHKDGFGAQVIIITLDSHTVLEFGYYPDAPARATKVFPLMIELMESGDAAQTSETVAAEEERLEGVVKDGS